MLEDDQQDIEQESSKTFSVVDIVKSAFGKYKEDFAFYFTFGLINGVCFVGGQILLSSLGQVAATLIITLLPGSFIALALLSGCVNRYHGREVTVSQCFKVAQTKYFKYLLVFALMMFMFSAGFMLFIIPGIVLATIFMFANILVVSENMSAPEVFFRSKDLVVENFAKVFQYMLLMSLIVVGFTLFFSMISKVIPMGGKIFENVFSVILYPFMTIAQIELYYYIRILKEGHVEFDDDLSDQPEVV